MAKFDLSNVSFLQKGAGEDLVLMHGYLSSKEVFSAQMEYFSKFYRVTAFDFLGFGQSGSLNTPFSVQDYADWTAALFESLGIKRPKVIAHSFGCRVAVKMAKDGGQVFDKILLTGAAGIILKRGFSYRVRVKTYKVVKKFFPNFAEKKFGSEEYKTLSPIMKESYKKIVNEDLRGCARLVENQVLIVQGREDKTTTLKEAEVYLNSFKSASLKVMAGGHFSFLEYPVQFNLLAEEFFYG